jgi:RND family efflux transporter MFP subunit
MRHFNLWSSRRRNFAACAIAVAGLCGAVPWKLAAQRPGESPQATSQRLGSSRPTTSPAGVRQYTFASFVLTDSITVRASREGVAEKVLCRLGDHVTKGQLVVQFDESVLQADLNQAQAALNKDVHELERYMRRESSVPKAEILDAQAHVQVDKAQIVARERALEAASMRAPMDGVISELSVHEGEYVGNGTSLMVVVSVTDLRAAADIPADVCTRLHLGQLVQFDAGIFSKPFEGKIDFISPVADTRSNTFSVRALIDDPSRQLRPGLQGQFILRLQE